MWGVLLEILLEKLAVATLPRQQPAEAGDEGQWPGEVSVALAFATAAAHGDDRLVGPEALPLSFASLQRAVVRDIQRSTSVGYEPAITLAVIQLDDETVGEPTLRTRKPCHTQSGTVQLHNFDRGVLL